MMKLWIARDICNINLKLFFEKPVEQEGNWVVKHTDKFNRMYYGNRILIDNDLFPEVTFKNSPQEVEVKLINKMQLTREYFSSHGWEIINHKPDENGFVLWEARWIRYMENGSPYYCKLYVSNIMYPKRFVMNGETKVGDFNFEVYTEEELIAILKVIGIYDYYKKESNT